MKRLTRILRTLFFPSLFNKDFLYSLPKAPEPISKNIFALYDYHHPLGKKLIYAIKKRRDGYVSEIVAKEMKLHLQEYLSEQQQFSYYLDPCIVPVPLTRKQQRTRGFNQNTFIARHLADYVNGKYTPVVKKIKETQKQALVNNRSERFLNVRGCFDIPHQKVESIRGKDIIIVDDLVTTGATIMEIEKVLHTYGARNVIAITVAH